MQIGGKRETKKEKKRRGTYRASSILYMAIPKGEKKGYSLL